MPPLMTPIITYFSLDLIRFFLIPESKRVRWVKGKMCVRGGKGNEGGKEGGWVGKGQ